MMHWTVIIANPGDIDFWQNWTKPGSTVFEILLVIGILFAVALLAFLSVVLVMSPWRKRRAYPKGQTPPGAADGRRRKRRSRLFRMLRRHRHHHGRRRRRRRRPVNPTLAQTGGLPPPREEQPGAH